jgi:hypothetical protein
LEKKKKKKKKKRKKIPPQFAEGKAVRVELALVRL